MSDRMRALLIMLALSPVLVLASYWGLKRKVHEQVERTKAVWPVTDEQGSQKSDEGSHKSSVPTP
jgi:hypothetical protein